MVEVNSEKKNKGGRPRIVINEEEFKKLCGLHCTLTEIAAWFNCSEDTIENWCKRELKMGFSEAFKKFSSTGKMSLRRWQFQMAEHSVPMAIWLGKQWLGQKEPKEVLLATENDESVNAMNAYFEKCKKKYDRKAEEQT